MIEFTGEDCQIVSDRKGIMFILGQLISNSVKYTKEQDTPMLSFDVQEDAIAEQITLSINDNGRGIPASDLPFVLTKGLLATEGAI